MQSKLDAEQRLTGKSQYITYELPRLNLRHLHGSPTRLLNTSRRGQVPTGTAKYQRVWRHDSKQEEMGKRRQRWLRISCDMGLVTRSRQHGIAVNARPTTNHAYH